MDHLYHFIGQNEDKGQISGSKCSKNQLNPKSTVDFCFISTDLQAHDASSKGMLIPSEPFSKEYSNVE